MNEILKKIFQRNLENKVEAPIAEEFDRGQMTYEEWGFDKARNLQGNLLAFKGCLSLVKRQFLQEQGLDEGKAQKNINNAKAKEVEANTDIEKEQTLIDTLEKRIEDKREKISSLKKEIIKIEENPKSLSIDKASKVGFVFGLLILAFLTVYLFVFYSSASYSGFFKKFEEDFMRDSESEGGVASAIFDPQAISKAYFAGATEMILILTIPFVFLGLGYLIHKFQEGKGFGKYLKIGALVLITFAFDALLAYKIEAGLYKVEVLNAVQDLPPHSLSMAIASENFWLVIFAGFIVYIIWGFIFDFVMDSYDKLDGVKQAINARKKEIEEIEEEIQKTQNDILAAKNNIAELKKKIAGYRAIIDGDITIIDWAGFEKKMLNFTTGWTHWMTANKIDKSLINTTWEVQTNFINEHKIDLNKKEGENETH